MKVIYLLTLVAALAVSFVLAAPVADCKYCHKPHAHRLRFHGICCD